MRTEMDTLLAKIERYEGFLTEDPDNTALLISLGDLYHQIGQFDKAANTYNSVLALDGQHQIAASRKAGVLLSQGKLEEALAAYRTLQQTEKSDPVIELNAAICQFCLYQFDEAEAVFMRVTGNDGVGRTARFYMASIMQVRNKVSDALIQVEQLLSEQSEVYLVGYKSTLLYTLGRLDEAVHVAKQVLKDDSSNPDACSTLGTFYIENFEMEIAKPLFEKMTMRSPGDARGWHGLGLVAMLQGFMATAIELFEKSTRLLPKSAGMWTTLAWAYFNNKQYKEAEYAFERVIELNRNNPDGWGGYACALAMQTKLPEANKAADYAIRMDKHAFSAVFAKSLILALKGKKETAEKVLAALLEQPVRPDGEKAIELINRYMNKRNSEESALVTANNPKQIH